MTAIELYYANLPNPAGPYYAGDDESLESGHIPNEMERQAEWEYMMMLSAGINPASFEQPYYDF